MFIEKYDSLVKNFDVGYIHTHKNKQYYDKIHLINSKDDENKTDKLYDLFRSAPDEKLDECGTIYKKDNGNQIIKLYDGKNEVDNFYTLTEMKNIKNMDILFVYAGNCHYNDMYTLYIEDNKLIKKFLFLNSCDSCPFKIAICNMELHGNSLHKLMRIIYDMIR